MADFAAAWQDSDKLVYSTTLTEPITKRSRTPRQYFSSGALGAASGGFGQPDNTPVIPRAGSRRSPLSLYVILRART